MIDQLRKNPVLAVHDESFQNDDMLFTASFHIMLDGNMQPIRTRDAATIEHADIVGDVGSIYDPDRLRFDHHQVIGAPEPRNNGIHYSAFGLLWKHYGERVCEKILGKNNKAKETAAFLDEHLVQFIDANDSGDPPPEVDFVPIKTFSGLDRNLNALDDEVDHKCFLDALPLYVKLLTREIHKARKHIESVPIFEKAFQESDGVILELEENIGRPDSYAFDKKEYQSILYCTYPSGAQYKVFAIRKTPELAATRQPLLGKGASAEDLNALYGIDDAIFCHKTGFTMGVCSKESAYKVALHNTRQ